MKLMFTLTLILFSFLFLWLAGRRNSKKQQLCIARNCRQVSPDETILVCIVSRQDSLATAYTVLDLYKKAFCPNRVFVAIVQFYGPADKIDALQKYQQSCSEGFDFSDNIRIMSLKTGPAPQNGMYFIQQQLYAQEKYVLQVYSETVFAENWDKVAIQELEACRSGSFLTQFPLVAGSRKQLPSFIRWRKGGSSSTEGRFFKKRPPAPVPAPFWCSDFVFSYAADRFFQMPETSQILDDYGYGAKAFAAGLHLYYPTRMITEPGNVYRKNTRKCPCVVPASISEDLLAGYEYWCGVSRTGIPNAAGLAGWNKVQPEAEQIRQKYGSRKKV
jgi:hypothetical protein